MVEASFTFVVVELKVQCAMLTRKKIGEKEWKSRSISSNYNCILCIHMYDDGYEEYSVFCRHKDGGKVDNVFHGYDLTSAIADWSNRDPTEISTK
jgi:hypothetical protein